MNDDARTHDRMYRPSFYQLESESFIHRLTVISMEAISDQPATARREAAVANGTIST